MKKNNKNKGITLIALVVTIVALLILAGVSINLVIGNKGIITMAQKAKKETNISNIRDDISLILDEYIIDNNLNKDLKLRDYIEDKIHTTVIGYGNNGCIFVYNDYKVTLDNNSIISIEKNDLKEYFVDDYGAIGDGKTNDFEAIQRAVDDCYNNGGGIVTFDGSKTYLLGRPTDWPTSIEYHTTCAINLKKGVNINGNGCKIEWYHTNGVFNTDSRERNAKSVAHLTENIVKGQYEIFVDDTSNYSVGDEIVLFGEDNETGDKYETKDWMFNKIISINKENGKIEFEKPIDFNIDLRNCNNSGSISNGKYNGAIMNIEIYEKSFIKNMTISNHGNGRGASIYLVFARDVSIENIIGDELYRSVTSLQYVDNCILNHYTIKNYHGDGLGYGTLQAYECKNINIKNSKFDNFYGTVLGGESYNRNIVFDNCEININNKDLSSLTSYDNRYSIINSTIGCDINIKNTTFNIQFDNMYIVTHNYVRDCSNIYENITINTQENFNLMFINSKDIKGTLTLGCGGKISKINFDNKKQIQVSLAKNEAQSNGYLRKVVIEKKIIPTCIRIEKLENCNFDDINSLLYGENYYPTINLKDNLKDNKMFDGRSWGFDTNGTNLYLKFDPFVSITWKNETNDNSIINLMIEYVELN